MTITEEKIGNVSVLHIKGKINFETDRQFSDKLESVRNEGTDLIVNLTDLDYIASSGLRVFLVNLKAYKAQGRSFRLTNLSAPIAEVFKISGFESLFEIYPSVEEALS
jgi:anti-sigma B factor antagonist